jgi:hypothetical protein
MHENVDLKWKGKKKIFAVTKYRYFRIFIQLTLLPPLSRKMKMFKDEKLETIIIASDPRTSGANHCQDSKGSSEGT